jgi:hypothetical protein
MSALAATSLVPSTVLPRAAALTNALLAPAGQAVPAPDRVALAERLRTALGRSGSARVGNGRRLTVGAFFLRTPTAGSATPFRWTARTARRTIGLAAVRACPPGGRRAPADAVADVMAAMAADGRRGLGRPGGVERWLASLPAGGTAAVAAEATIWATGLVGAVTWDRMDGAAVGAADGWWDVGRDVAVRGRADVRVPIGAVGGGGPRPAALLTVVGGRPEPTSRVALGLPALVAAVGRSHEPVPARVAGWWPECGRALVVPVDGELLDTTAAAVVEAVRAARAASSVTTTGG